MSMSAAHEARPAAYAGQRLGEAIFARRPILRETLQAHGDLSLVDYIDRLSDYRVHPVYLPRIQRLGELVRGLYAPLWGADLVDRAVEKLVRRPVVLTADHAGMLMYPVYIQGNIIFGLREILEQRGIIINFFSGLVPLDTASIPGGIFLSETYTPENSRRDGSDPVGRKVNANLFLYTKRRTRHCYACGAPGYDHQKLEAAPGRITSFLNRKIIGPRKAAVLRELLDTLVKAPEIQRRPTLIEQAALINRLLFRRYLPEAAELHLLSFQLERVAAEWLREQLARRDTNSPTVRLLLDPGWRGYALERFNGINPSCWDFDGDGRLRSGTFLFWGIDAAGRAVRLREEAGELRGKDGFRIELNRQSLLAGLSKGRIVPNIFLVFCVLAFECGLCCFGGFMQVWYLEKIKRGWLSLLARFGLIEQAKLVQTVPVTGFVTGLAPLLFERDGEAYLPDGADLILAGGLGTGELQRVSSAAFRESLLPALPFIYRSMFGAEAEYAYVDMAEILQEQGLREKLLARVSG